MPELIDLTGQTFGWLKVVSYGYKGNDGVIYWDVECLCGQERTIAGGSLRSGRSRSCGCYKEILNQEKSLGQYKTPTYNTWDNMVGRCTRASQPDYDKYGGRGITVCEEWRTSFRKFYEDMGDRPPGKTIDRKNVNGNYEKDNCQWSDQKTQQNNKTNNIRIPFQGEILSPEEYSERTGIPLTTVRNRIFQRVPLTHLHLTPGHYRDLHE